MADDILGAAKAEESRLEAELQAHPTYRKLVAIRALIALYAGPAVPVRPSSPQTDLPNPNAARRIAPREGTKTARLGAAAEAYLRRIGRRAQSPEIVRALMAEGFEFKSDRPVNAVASALSHNDLFDNVPGQGYGLREWTERPETVQTLQPQDASTDDGTSRQRDLVTENANSVDSQFRLGDVS